MIIIRIISAVSQSIDALIDRVGALFAWFSMAMAIVITGLVIARAFGFGSIALQELVTYFHVFLITMAMAYTLQHNGHIRVDIFYRDMSPLKKAWINTLGTIFFLMPFALFIVIVSWASMMTSWQIIEGSDNSGGIPAKFILKSLLPALGVSLLLQAISELCRNIIVLSFISPSDEEQK